MSLDNPPPHLLRAVSSNSSLNSISSLTRRPRAKARSKTVASDSAPADAAVQATGTSYLGSDIVQEPLSSTDADGITLEQSRSEEPNTASNTIPDSARLSKTAQQASRLSSIKTGFKPPPSAFSRVPLSQIDSEPSAVNIRDSVLTQDSEITQQTHSSSVYPLSTLSASTTSHPSPTYTVPDKMPDQISGVDDIQSFDGDDVSYRLRLLVNNSYFLPPAHSKPLQNQLFPTSPKKPPTPTGLLDIFRLGKSKSKSPIDGGTDAVLPALRTTSDSTQVSGFPTPVQPQSSTSNPPRMSYPNRLADRLGRVVVVREKMSDLVSAAKQAELEMKARPRDDRIEEDVIIDPTDSVDLPVMSPDYPFAVQTSALHGLSASESVSAAALANHLPPRSPIISSVDHRDDWKKALLEAAVGHSFESLNAAAEGRYTSPPRSPAPLLTVPLSTKLDKKIISSPITLESGLTRSTINPPSTSISKPLASPLGSPSPIPVRTETPSMPLEPLMPPPRRQFINPVYSLSQTDLTDTAEPVSSSSHSQQKGPSASSSLADEYRQKGLTMTPTLTLPKHLRLARDSVEYRDFSGRDSRLSTTASRLHTRSVTPDSQSNYSVVVDPRPSNDSGRSRASSVISASSTAPSPSTSAFQDALSRSPSEVLLEEIGNKADSPKSERLIFGGMSPTQTKQSHSTQNPPVLKVISSAPEHVSPPARIASLHHRDLRERVFTNPTSPQKTVSPPPFVHRSASDHGHGSTHFTSKLTRRPPTAPAASLSTMSSPQSESGSNSLSGPNTPPCPTIRERRLSRNPLPTLSIPASNIPAQIHSAPLVPSSSPMSFFDTIQTQPNVMDFLDESDDESESDGSLSGDSDNESDSDGTFEARVSIAHSFHSVAHSTYSSRSVLSTHSTPAGSRQLRSPLMRFGNHSTPYVSRSALNDSSDVPPPLPTSSRVTDRRPIGNVPRRAPFFTKKIREESVLDASLDLSQHTKPSTSKHLHTLPDVRQFEASPERGQTKTTFSGGYGYGSTKLTKLSADGGYTKGKESEKLDGLLMIHIEAEKNRIKRMADRLKKS